MVVIHFGSSGGGGVTTAESTVDADGCGGVTVTLVLGTGTAPAG
jgi:hypothetical protein